MVFESLHHTQPGSMGTIDGNAARTVVVREPSAHAL